MNWDDRNRRQCEKIRACGLRCRKDAHYGTNVCVTHGARRRISDCGINGKLRVLPRFYRKVLSHTLLEAVQAQLEYDTSEQLSLLEELAIMRALASNTLTLYAKAEETTNPEAMMSASLLVRDALKEIRDLCESASRVENSRKDVITPLALRSIVQQIIILMYEVCGDENEHLARALETKINEEVRVPAEMRPTMLDPTTQVANMIASIPNA